MSEWINVICENCCIEFKKRRSEIKRSPRHFHSRECYREYRMKENADILLSKAMKNKNGCLEWVGAKNNFGYGVVRYFGKQMLAHKAVYIHTYGSIDNAVHVLHKCDNPPCINIKHLFSGTHKDNMHDMIRKGRKSTILNHDKVTEIRKSDISNKDLAILYGVSERTIRYAKNPKSWQPLNQTEST